MPWWELRKAAGSLPCLISRNRPSQERVSIPGKTISIPSSTFTFDFHRVLFLTFFLEFQKIEIKRRIEKWSQKIVDRVHISLNRKLTVICKLRNWRGCVTSLVGRRPVTCHKSTAIDPALSSSQIWDQVLSRFSLSLSLSLPSEESSYPTKQNDKKKKRREKNSEEKPSRKAEHSDLMKLLGFYFPLFFYRRSLFIFFNGRERDGVPSIHARRRSISLGQPKTYANKLKSSEWSCCHRFWQDKTDLMIDLKKERLDGRTGRCYMEDLVDLNLSQKLEKGEKRS